MGIGSHLHPWQAPEGDAVHFVQRTLGVAGAAAAAEIRREPNLLPHLDAPARAESLEKIFVEQSGADQGRIKGRDVAKIVVVEIQLDSRMRIHAQGDEVAAQAGAGGRCGGVALGIVDLRRLVNRDVALVGKRIFEENEWPVDVPVHHADPRAAGAAVVEAVVLAAFEVDERAADHAVRAVVPRRGIGRGAAENSQRRALGESLAEISAVDGVEAGRPGQIQAAKSRDQRRVGIVVGHVQVVGAVDQVLQRLLAGGRRLGQLVRASSR